MWQRSDYLELRRRFEPKIVRLVIVAESPPASGKYFYDPTGAISEPLFAALMQEIGFSPTGKESGLREFQTTGWVLIDATYTPVNGLSDTERDKIVVEDYQSLRADLTALLPDKSTPVILIKANVCRLLEHQLNADGFRVLNNGRVVYFPSTGRQQEFHLQFNQIVESARVSEIPAHFKKIPELARVKQILELARPREQPLPRWRRFLPERDQVLTALKWVGRGLELSSQKGSRKCQSNPTAVTEERVGWGPVTNNAHRKLRPGTG